MKNTVIIFLALLMIACTPKHDNKNEKTEEQVTPLQPEITQPEEININQDILSETSEVKFYNFFDDGESITHEYQTVNISSENMPAVTNQNLGRAGIEVQNIYYEGSRLIVDLAPIMEQTMDHGSSGSLCKLHSMLYTFASFPGVKEIKILINGVEDIEGSHFSFNRIFSAEEYIMNTVSDF